MNVKTIIFDFDGTIANTFDPIIDIYNSIAPKYNCKIVTPQERIQIKDQRPQDAFKSFNVTRFKIPFIVYEVRRILRQEIKDTPPYEGILEALIVIKNAGFRLGIMTSNSKKNVALFLKENEIDTLFDFIYSGRNLFNKADVLRKLLRKENLEKNNCFYIGDETRDIEATQKIGLPIISVSWGFNSEEALQKLHPIAIAHTPKDLVDALLSLR